MLHIRGKFKPMAGQVNLDALVKREDLFKITGDDSGLSEIPENKIFRIVSVYLVSEIV